jgi:thiaminase/transcriptional activator TenA
MEVLKSDLLSLTEALAKPKISSMLKSIAQQPFLQELAAGTLPFHDFMAYIAQDLIYLDVYHACFERLIDICPYDHHLKILISLKADIENERQFFWHWLSAQEPSLSHTRMNLATLNYTRYLCDHVNLTYSHGISALYPCTWVYRKIAMLLVNSAHDESAYLFWIRRYSDSAFEGTTDKHLYLVESALADPRNNSLLSDELSSLLLRGMELEKDFWASCYGSQKAQTL